MIQEKQFIENGEAFKEVVGPGSFIYRYATCVHQFPMNGMTAFVCDCADALQRSIVTAEIERYRGIVGSNGRACMSTIASAGEIEPAICRVKQIGETPGIIRSKRLKRIQDELSSLRQKDLRRRCIREILLG